VKKIVFEPIERSIETDPNNWVKYEYHPFSPQSRSGSITWRIFYFSGLTPRGKVKYYESYGRSKEEAKVALLKALLPGRNKPRAVKSITKSEFKANQKKRKK